MGDRENIFDVVRTGDTQRLQALLKADPALANARDERGNTPVLIAQYRDKRDAVAVLLAAAPELDIFDAAAVGRTARVAEWLDRDPALRDAQSSLGFGPLALAAFFGQAETVKLLLARGADPKPAAPLAAMKGHHDILKLLKEHA
ncbi:MAG TPA: ankyrin repeat domain-containing protein [Gemmatimonadales bacterium]|jgi:ankyrin repeat protein|nr:ankyrin repeat domain-containing protein [Gemmatimonadales bacterium]